MKEAANQTAAFSSLLYSTETCRALREELGAIGTPSEHIRIEALSASASTTASTSAPRWLQEFCQLCKLDKASITLDLVSSQKSSSVEIIKYGAMALRYSYHGTTLRGDQLSFGQKRLFSILHYLDANKPIVVADELVNGLHHEWIEHCVGLLEDRQAFLSSQNPILFDFMYFESAEEAAARFIECSLDEQGRFVWCNMPADDAEEFHATYQVGIQHVSAILRTKGYW